MQFDDRLATVMRTRTGSLPAAHTQYRQLLDLVGSAPAGADAVLMRQAYERLGSLSEALPAVERAAILREPWLRLRNPELVAWLSAQNAQIASATLANARLADAQWQDLIPALPVPARAYLRERRDLPAEIRILLGRLGVAELGLPQPENPILQPEIAKPEARPPYELASADADDSIFDIDPALELDEEAEQGIGALVKRIEAFRLARKADLPDRTADSPRLPLDEQSSDNGRAGPQTFDFQTDAAGQINWADAEVAAALVGLQLASEWAESPSHSDTRTRNAMRRRQPIRSGHVQLSGAPAISGEWQIDAVPHFSRPSGYFTGFHGRMRRPVAAPEPEALESAHGPADRMREMLHELRTPVNAVQGFAEIIQQQLFGPTPNEYRALAASIAGDAARMLAGFDELDRLAKLESGSMELDEGTSDLASAVSATTSQLSPVLAPRNAGFTFRPAHQHYHVAMAHRDLEHLIWRLFASIAGAAGPGEELNLALDHAEGFTLLSIELPQSLLRHDDIFDSAAQIRQASISAGMFGAGFTLRLARAEARAAGGDLLKQENRLILSLPPQNGEVAQQCKDDVSFKDHVASIG